MRDKLIIATVGLVLAGTSPALANHGTGTHEGSMMQSGRMMGTGMLMPRMDPGRGRKLFASKGCVVCHSVNGVGGEDAPPLDAANMKLPMNPFEFAARMWRGASAMVMMQEEELGAQIELDGQDLADIIAFIHNEDEQKHFSEADIPDNITKLMAHLEDDDEEHEAEHEAAGESGEAATSN